MKITIGQIKDMDGKKLEACRVVDTATGEVKNISYNKIREQVVTNKQKIKGFVVTEITDYYNIDNIKVKESMKHEKGKFSFEKIPQLKGTGELVNPEDSRFITVYGWKGFAEDKVYYCYDYQGNIIKLNIKEFDERVRRREVNGAFINPRTKKVAVCEDLSIEIED